MRKTIITYTFLLSSIIVSPLLHAKQTIKALYIPLADHYAGIVAYEKYRTQMKHADFKLERMKSWPRLRAYFLEESLGADMAFVMSPLAMDMFNKSPSFRWIGQMHRDGNALAINDREKIQLPEKRDARKPTAELANELRRAHEQMHQPIQVAVPDLLATHAVVMYKYLRDNNKTMALGNGKNEDVVLIPIAPPKAPGFIKKKSKRGEYAAFEQSLPWADVVETRNFGKVAWYSKDVLQWPNGHVECIVVAKDSAITEKNAAIREIIHFIHKAGEDIEEARRTGGKAIKDIAAMVRKHIPEHNEEAITQSLRPDLIVINYKHLNIDKPGLRMIMDLAVEAGILQQGINIDHFSDPQFSTDMGKF